MVNIASPPVFEAAAVPHRDALFACSLRDHACVERLRERAAFEAGRARSPITTELLRVAPGGALARLDG